MAKERTVIGIRLKEFLYYIRENINPDDCRVEGDRYYIGEYCLTTSKPNILEKNGEWSINFTDMYGQYYSTLVPLFNICLKETDVVEKAQDVCKLDKSINELLDKAAKFELLNEVNDAIRNNYSESLPEIFRRTQNVLDSYRAIL